MAYRCPRFAIPAGDHSGYIVRRSWRSGIGHARDSWDLAATEMCIEAPSLKWARLFVQAHLFAGTEGIGRFFIEDFASHLLPFVCVEPKHPEERVFRQPLRLSAFLPLV